MKDLNHLIKFGAGSFLLALLVVLSFQNCNRKVQSHFVLKEEVIYQEPEKPTEHNCADRENHAPDASNAAHTPIRWVRVNFHFVSDESDTNNFTGEAGKQYTKEILYEANLKLSNNCQMKLPPENNTDVLPLRWQYVLAGDASIPGDDGIYFHSEASDLAYHIKKGAKENRYSSGLFNKYKVRPGEVLNIFMIEHPPDSIESPTYKASADGLGFPRWVKVAGSFDKYHRIHYLNNGKEFRKGPKYMANLLNHEIGHSLGLAHTWNQNDGCDDTPKNPGCWGWTGKPPCDKKVSNNLMDYNGSRCAISPCQIWRVQSNFARDNSSQRKLLMPSWCDYKPEDKIVIGPFQNIVWKGSKDLESDIEVRGTLTLKCRVALPKDARIIIAPKGKLVLDGCTITNLCGEKWRGIEIQEGEQSKAQVIWMNNPKLENMSESFEIPEAN